MGRIAWYGLSALIVVHWPCGLSIQKRSGSSSLVNDGVGGCKKTKWRYGESCRLAEPRGVRGAV